MSKKNRMSGNEAIANAIRQIDPDVIAAFPITPSTEIPQYISKYKADGLITTEFVAVESEHSAMSACVGASAAGIRAMTATSSAGMALMYEMLYIAASDRLPIVIAAVNRTLTGPININTEHSDSMGARDSGWIQLYSENAQEAYDNMLMAHRIAEHPDVMLPVMVCQDGFITSHAVENILLEDDAAAKAFVGEYDPPHHLLDPAEAVAVGPYSVSPYVMEMKVAQSAAMARAGAVILDVAADFEKAFGRRYGLFEEYRMDGAELVLVIMSSAAGTAKVAVDRLRGRGVKAGLIKLRAFRPFPAAELAKALAGTKAVAVMDRSEGYSGNGGPLGAEVRMALYGRADGIKAINIVFGLGGRDARVEDFEALCGELAELVDKDPANIPYFRHMGQRE
jgi:pyruvate ferredoxin oxidoreductase alpha subunit